jgi:hypothetical protein
MIARSRPYPDFDSSAEIFAFLAAGNRLLQPDVRTQPLPVQASARCVDDLYSKVVSPAWDADESRRPSFGTLSDLLGEMLHLSESELNGPALASNTYAMSGTATQSKESQYALIYAHNNKDYGELA